ncbi:MAG: hypothetical protein J0I07_07870 [Myxococcales bacterium]|nr:hypothetical protein [Myxococcales bacterium]
MRGILEFVGDGVTAEDTTADDGTPVTRVTIEAPPLPPIPPAPNGGFGQLLVSNGAGGYSTAITPPGSLVGTQVTQTLSNKTLASPVITGTPQYAATRGRIYSVVGEVETTSPAQKTVASFTVKDETLCAFDIIVTCARRTNVTKGGRWKRSVVYRRTGGTSPVIVGTEESGTDQTTSGGSVLVYVSGFNVVVSVEADDADPRNWLCEMRVQETLAT